MQPSLPSTGWSLWWRWVAYTVGGTFLPLAVFAVVVLAGGRRPPGPLPTLGVAAAGLASSAIVGALQSRLLRGHVRAPDLWLAIALIDGVFLVLTLLYRTGGGGIMPLNPPAAWTT